MLPKNCKIQEVVRFTKFSRITTPNFESVTVITVLNSESVTVIAVPNFEPSRLLPRRTLNPSPLLQCRTLNPSRLCTYQFVTSTSPPPGHTPGHLNFFIFIGQIPLPRVQKAVQMPHPRAIFLPCN